MKVLLLFVLVAALGLMISQLVADILDQRPYYTALDMLLIVFLVYALVR